MDPYQSSLEHLRDELGRLDLLLRKALVVARKLGAASGPDELRGLVISEPEIDALLAAPNFLGDRWQWVAGAQEELRPIDQQLTSLRETIDARVELSRSGGVKLALPGLAERFGLSPPEVDLLLIGLAPELEPRYETIFGYLQNDVTRKRPSIDLALNLICQSEEEKFLSRRYLEPGAPLLDYRLIQLGEEAHDRQPSLLRKFLKLNEAIVRFLLDQSPPIRDIAELLSPPDGIALLEVEPATKKALAKPGDLFEACWARWRDRAPDLSPRYDSA